MRFAIQEEKPYLISGGKAYPVKLTEHNGVNISIAEGIDTELTGYLTYEELAAKLGKIEAEILPQETELLGVHVYDLISPGTKVDRDGFVEGTLYQAKVEQFSSKKSEQSGYYFPITLTKTGETLTTVKNGKTRTQPFPDDNILLILVPNKNTTVQILVDGVELTTLRFNKAVFSAKDSPYPLKGEYAFAPFGQKKDFGRFGKWDEYVESFAVVWDGANGKASGTLKAYDGTDGRNEKVTGKGNFLPVVLSAYYADKPVTVFCKNEKEPQNATDWIMTITDVNVPLKVKYNDEIVAQIDLTDVVLQA